MLRRSGTKLGDTLIEVTLAIGIFSMVAIAVVSVVSASTTGAQTALETTLTREEIDTQAEALRFIQESYANSIMVESDESAGGESEEEPSIDTSAFYSELWGKITQKAIEKVDGDEYIDVPSQPTTCRAIYDHDEEADDENKILKNAFVINARSLGDNSIISSENAINNVFIEAKFEDNDYNEKFYATSTYPRLVYGNNNLLTGVEGIYVLAVRDPGSTMIVDANGKADATPAYYDFYIRTCWYAAGADTPNTIATVIRLYDPDVIHGINVDEYESPEEEEDEGPWIQDVTLADCKQNVGTNGNATNIGDTIGIYKDKRDNSAYNIRYINGQCWMTQNLHISGTISAAESNFSSGDFNVSEHNLNRLADVAYCDINDTSASNPKGYTNVCSYNTYYNYAAATAGAVTGYSNGDNAPTNHDICPRRWRLPTGPSTESGSDLNRLIGNGNSGWQSPTSGLVAFDGVAGGFYGAGYVDPDGHGYWWTTRANGDRSRRLLSYNSLDGTFNGNYSGYRVSGYFIRCVLQESESVSNTYTVIYHSNDGTGGTDTQEYEVGASVLVPGSELFHRDGYNLLRWTTESGGGGSSYDQATYYFDGLSSTPGITINLYAQWEETAKEYSITYRANRWLGDTWTSTQSGITGTSVTLDHNNFTNDGYNFTGWKKDNVGTLYGDRSTVSIATLFGSSTSISLYAQWEKEEEPTMQDFTTSKCQSLANSSDYTLKDKRDGQTYTVRYINGLCWMTKNLNLAGRTTLTSSLSNVSSSYTLPTSSASGFNIMSTSPSAYVYNSGSTSCGSSRPCYSYYSHLAACAGSNSCSQDICPKNWRLPTQSEYGSLRSSYSTGNALTSAPFRGVYAGNYIDRGFKEGGESGDYWTSTQYGSLSYSAYHFAFWDTGSMPLTGINKNHGFAVRCVTSI